MNPRDHAYIENNHDSKTVREMARELGISRIEVQQAVDRMRKTVVPAPQTPLRRHVLLLTGLIVFTFSVYARTLPYPFTNWDDPKYVTENPDIRNFSSGNLEKIFTRSYCGVYAPLTMLSFAADFQLYKFNATGYRASNLTLHLISVALVYLLVLLLGAETLPAFGAAAIFALHPVQIESIVWISQRKNVLSFMLYLAAFLCHVLSRKSSSRRTALLSFLFFVLACLAKPLSLTLPGIMLVYDHVYGFLRRKDLGRYAPFVLVSVLFMVVSVYFSKTSAAASAGAAPAPGMLLAPAALMKYLHLAFWPLHLSIRYPFPDIQSPASPLFLASLLGSSALLAGLILLYLRKRPLFFWGAWGLILLSPTLNILPQLDYVQDRWLYLPIGGLFLILFSLVRSSAGYGICIALIAVSTLTLTGLNLRHQSAWEDPEALWKESQKESGEGWNSAHFNLGRYYESQGKLDSALMEYERALSGISAAGAYRGMGNIFTRQKLFDKASEAYRKALERDPLSPVTHNSLGFLKAAQGLYAEALTEFDKAAALDPSRPEIQSNRGRALALLGKSEEAEKAFQAGLTIDPDAADPLMNYAGFLLSRNRLDEAEAVAQKFMNLHADSPQSESVKAMLAEIRGRKSRAAGQP